MLKANNAIELFTKIEQDNLYLKLVQQLNKDFQLSNLEFHFEETITPIDLQKALTQHLLKLISNQYDDYLNLLYRIDIAETELLKVRSENIEDAINQVTFLVLKREAQKVWLKKNFSD